MSDSAAETQHSVGVCLGCVRFIVDDESYKVRGEGMYHTLCLPNPFSAPVPAAAAAAPDSAAQIAKLREAAIAEIREDLKAFNARWEEKIKARQEEERGQRRDVLTVVGAILVAFVAGWLSK